MLDAKRCRRVLGQCLPDLDVRSVRHFARGWDYELWEVNGDLLFRFPQRPEAAEPLRKETRLLAELAGTLSPPVPRPEYLADGCEAFPLPFVGYRKLPGLPLDAATLSEQSQAAIARQLGGFLTELHRFPPARAAELSVPHYSPEAWRARYREFRAECRRHVSPLLLPDERSAVEAFWQRFLDDERHFRFEPVLIHGDLGLEHVLVDPERAALTGIIDFADAVIGDPALDFAGFDDILRQAVLASYDLPVDEIFPVRAARYWQIGPFHQVLYGLQIQERKHVEAGLDDVRRRIAGGKKHK